jgi:hypothetical protein
MKNKYQFVDEKSELVEVLREDIKIGQMLKKLVELEEWKFLEKLIMNQIDSNIEKILSNNPDINKEQLIGETNGYRKLLYGIYNSIEKGKIAITKLEEEK